MIVPAQIAVGWLTYQATSCIVHRTPASKVSTEMVKYVTQYLLKASLWVLCECSAHVVMLMHSHGLYGCGITFSQLLLSYFSLNASTFNQEQMLCIDFPLRLCFVYVDAAVKESLEAQKLDWNEAAGVFVGDDCIVPGSSQRYDLSEYLTQPDAWVESVPTVTARSSSGGGSTSGPSAAVIAGTVIGVVVAAAIIGGLIFWGVKKARNRPMGYRKNEVPDYAVNVVGPQGTAAGVV
jgi:hypothetical protein